MLVSGSIPTRNFQDVASQKISTLGTREIAGFGSSIVEEKKKQKAKIKFKKIKLSDRIIAPDGILDDYSVEEVDVGKGFWGNIKQSLNIMQEKKSGTNFFLSGVSENVAKATKYFNSTYLITDIEAPEPYSGTGTEAVQSLLEKSIVDEETQGRIILYLTQIAPEDTSYKFFYKLGFRYIDETLNEKVKEAIDKNIMDLQLPPSYMYLPKVNMPKLLRYGHLF